LEVGIMLVDRERQLDELNALLQAPTARLVAVTGRRRLGKTTLLLHWARTSRHSYLYWVASHLPSNVLLRQFSQLVWQHANPGSHAPRPFSYEDRPQAFEELAGACQGDASAGQERHVVVLDEFPYAVASEPGLPSVLQNAWDHYLHFSNVCLVLCGSQVGMMEQLMAAYAMLGGVPAYLEQFSDSLSLAANVREHLFREAGLFRTDPDYLIGEQVRDLANYQAVLSAIAGERAGRLRLPWPPACRRARPSIPTWPACRDGPCPARAAGDRAAPQARHFAPQPLRAGRSLAGRCTTPSLPAPGSPTLLAPRPQRRGRWWWIWKGRTRI
jgi:hypothetical protein